MNRLKKIEVALALLLVFLSAGAWLDRGALAQGTAQVSGEVLDDQGKPFTDVVLVLKNTDTSQNWQVKVDAAGKFSQTGLPRGKYLLTVQYQGYPIHEVSFALTEGQQGQLKIDFKELKAKGQAGNLEAVRKHAEEQKKFENLKIHFDSGVAALEQARQVRTELQRAPADQRTALQDKVAELSGTAINEFQAAEKALSEKDSNRHIVVARLGDAYDAAGKYNEAVAAYQKAIELKPDQAGYYNNLGNILAKMGKIEEASAAYQKSATVDPPNAASAWRNFGIVLFQAGKAKEALDPLRKSLEIDPKNAQAWYVLGSALVGSMEFKQEGSTMVPVVQPGTVEAFQKCIELDPNGSYGAQAKQGLVQLEAMAPGIQTKVKAGRKKP